MFNELDQRWPEGVGLLRNDAMDSLALWGQVSVRLVPESDADADCSVAGAYLAEEAPPIVAVAASNSHGRRAFTALHELGHHLQQTTKSLVEALLKQPDDGHALEEAACNSFAAAVLLPVSVLGRHIGDAGPTAHNVCALWTDPAVRASRSAVCARAAEKLPAPGHILLLDDAGRVLFGASRGLPPVRRGSDQSRIPVVADQLRAPAIAHTGMTRMAYRDGITGEQLWAQTADMGGYTVLVAVIDHAPWESFAPPPRESGPQAKWWTCTNCGKDFPVWESRCAKCRAPKCPDCGQCECKTVAEKLCQGCYQLLPARLFDGGSDRCRDCAKPV
jgi:hypothetical protein